jgi:hypothetical protein
MLSKPIQLKAARALLGWDQFRLSKESGVAISTIRRQEHATEFTCTVPIFLKMKDSLEKAGIEFLNHGKPGVRLAS